ncbi:MAG: UDP-N-acetylmuramate dehydrogenase [Actinobacteria bacterium]|nr:UDP-N-acetylmuramate dehydrogenase [Actinomycetota bacterium]MBV8957766.1 UDP-N-acetylmuramate dehydrogenase [Actinomycetota bacterium]MBV9253174.1 UDP-N-acetylmuramate dehydrogenase [Actinomycetota bacterium]MBV9665121.1 UDP-N-acetylmuramate dehydrogenase [Actinomycetota bacterium]MBV9936014.1 UDP-N-acetylmuramate dehydrogenase [Actinomycetota bacterium]
MATTDAVRAAADLLGSRAKPDAPIGALTTYRVGGRAALLTTAESHDDLRLVASAVQASGLPVLVIGRGSNLLVADAGFPGLAVAMGEGLASIDVRGTTVRAGGATSLPVLARRTAAAGLTGLEWAVGVPGSVGGAVRMNAGGHGADTAATLTRFCFVDLRGGPDGEFGAERLEFAYRHSTVEPHHVVVWAEHGLRRGDVEESEAEIAEIVRWRRQNQPGGQNAGSVFTNPPGDSAGRLIDEAGLKGLRVGTAHVSEKHANFIQADDGGSADDVRALMDEVVRRVEEHAGITLHPEVRMVGFSE